MPHNPNPNMLDGGRLTAFPYEPAYSYDNERQERLMRFDTTVDHVLQVLVIPLAREEIRYVRPGNTRETVFPPMPVIVDPSIYRTFHCPPGCGGCCWRSTTLDWYPWESAPKELEDVLFEREITFNGNTFSVRSYVPQDMSAPCDFRRPTDGRCTIHGDNPFWCDISFMQVGYLKKEEMYALWNFTAAALPISKTYVKVDGQRGADCWMDNSEDAEKVAEYRAFQLRRLRRIMEHMKVKSCIDEVIATVENGPRDKRVVIDV